MPRLSSRVVCRRVVRSLASSHRLSVSVASCAESCRCQSRLVVRCLAARRREESRVIASCVVSSQLSPRREESRVSRVVCRLESSVSRLSSLRASSRWSVSVASCAESCRCQSRLVVRRPAARRQSGCALGV